MTKTYDKRHGGPYDRGSADAWYGRPRRPHFYLGGTHFSDRVDQDEMTENELAAYEAGYAGQGGRKDYGEWTSDAALEGAEGAGEAAEDAEDGE